MKIFDHDPAGIIPPGYTSATYTVIGYKLLRGHLYVMVEYQDAKGTLVQQKYRKVFADITGRGIPSGPLCTPHGPMKSYESPD